MCSEFRRTVSSLNFGNARAPAGTRVLASSAQTLSAQVHVVRAQGGAAGGGGAGERGGGWAGEDDRGVGHHANNNEIMMECTGIPACRQLYDWAMWARDGLVWRGWQRWWEARCCWRTGLPGLGGAGVGFWESEVMQCSLAVNVQWNIGRSEDFRSSGQIFRVGCFFLEPFELYK